MISDIKIAKVIQTDATKIEIAQPGCHNGLCSGRRNLDDLTATRNTCAIRAVTILISSRDEQIVPVANCEAYRLNVGRENAHRPLEA